MSMTTAVFLGMGSVVGYGLGALLVAVLVSKKRHHGPAAPAGVHKA